MNDEDEIARPTDNEPDQEWSEAYLALFGRRLDDDQVTLIETEVKRVFGSSLRRWEMTKAVRHCAINAPNGGRRYAPNGEELIQAVKAVRSIYAKRRMGGYEAHKCQMGYGTESYDQWSRFLRDADNEDERWNIICRPCDEKHCAQREKFCRDNGLSFAKYDHLAEACV